MTEDFSIPLETPMTAKARELAEENSLQPSDLPKKGSGKDGNYKVSDVRKAIEERRIIRSQELQRQYEREFPARMGWNWDVVEEQKTGTSVDYICREQGQYISSGDKIEVKFDWGSILHFNQSHFLEIQHKIRHLMTAEGGDTYLSQPRWEHSGFRLGVEQAQIWMVVNDHSVWIIRTEDLDQMLRDNIHNLMIRETGKHVGGNEGWRKAIGYSIPFSLIDGICVQKYRNTVPRDNEHYVENVDAPNAEEFTCTCCNGDSRAYDDQVSCGH